MSQFDFKEYDPKGRKAWYTLPLKGNPRLEMCHAGNSNRPYTNCVINRTARKGAGARDVTADTLKEALDDDRDAFSKFVVTGWDDVINTDGEQVPFSQQVCFEYLTALPDWIMQGVSSWGGRAVNFLPEESPSQEDAERQAGN